MTFADNINTGVCINIKRIGDKVEKFRKKVYHKLHYEQTLLGLQKINKNGFVKPFVAFFL